MSISYPSILGMRSSGERSWEARDAILYALGIGMGADPLDERQLQFVYERHHQVLPSFAAVLSSSLGVTVDRMGVNAAKMLHGEQDIRWHRVLNSSGSIVGEGRIIEVYDKHDKGSLIVTETTLLDQEDRQHIATVRAVLCARADGNCGAPRGDGSRPYSPPNRTPDHTVIYDTPSDLALLYRLSGDLNPLHVDPEFARAAGFERPILHGLCTYGIACRAIVETALNWQPERLARLAARFSAPVYPGERLRFDLWREDGVILFEATVTARGVIALKHGRAEIRS